MAIMSRVYDFPSLQENTYIFKHVNQFMYFGTVITTVVLNSKFTVGFISSNTCYGFKIC